MCKCLRAMKRKIKHTIALVFPNYLPEHLSASVQENFSGEILHHFLHYEL